MSAAAAKIEALAMIHKYGVRGSADALASAIEDMVAAGQPVPYAEHKGNDFDKETALACASTLKGRLYP